MSVQRQEVSRVEQLAVSLGWELEELYGPFWRIGSDGYNRPSVASTLQREHRIVSVDESAAVIDVGHGKQLMFRRSQ